MSEQNLLSARIESIMQQRDAIESRILEAYEGDIEKSLALHDKKEYVRIYVVTTSSQIESERFSSIIRKNILNNHQYIYVTPFEDSEFMTKLQTVMFDDDLSEDTDKHLLHAAFAKNIQHAKIDDIANLLPLYSDVVIYTTATVDLGSRREANVKSAFFCFQNGAITNDISQNEYYYYSQLDLKDAQRIDC